MFFIQMKYCLQSMHNHMVGRAASVVSPFYFISLIRTQVRYFMSLQRVQSELMIRRISINFLFNPISTGSLHILGRTRGGGVGAFNGEGARGSNGSVNILENCDLDHNLSYIKHNFLAFFL